MLLGQVQCSGGARSASFQLHHRAELRPALEGVRLYPLQSRTPFPRPFPRVVVRDLLGIVRALYRGEVARVPVDSARVEQLRQIGELYRLALEMGTKYEPDTMAGRAAIVKAERATVLLGEFVGSSDELTVLAVAATAERMRRRAR